MKRFGGCAALAVYAVLVFAPASEAQTSDELYRSAVAARQEQRFDEAADLLKRALALKPDNADALVQLGFAELGRGDLPAARDAFSKALAIAPDYADAKFGLAQIEFRSGNLDAALAIAEPLARVEPANDDFAGLVANIRKAKQARRTETTRKIATSKARRRAAHADAVSGLLEQGDRQRAAGKFAEAERSYRKALELAPRNTDVLVAIGLVAGHQKKFDEAGRFFDDALAIRPDDIDARLGKVRVAIWQGDVARARALIDAVTTEAPRNPDALVLDARIALLERDYDRAEQTFARAAAAQPKNAEALIGLGDVSRARGDDNAARQAYRRALALEPGSSDIEERLAAPPPRKWRLDLGSEVSVLSADLGAWTDNAVGLSYRITPDTTVGGRARVAVRHGQTDLQVEGRIDHVFSSSLSSYGLVAATPQADFLARFSVGGGASWQAVSRAGGFGPVFVNLDARYDRFSAADIVTVAPWMQIYVLDGRLGFSARWVHAQDDAGTRSDGYVLRSDVTVTPRLGVFIGYADAPEIDDGALIPTRSVFAGASLDLTDQLTLHGSLAHEERPTFDRNTFGLSLTARF